MGKRFIDLRDPEEGQKKSGRKPSSQPFLPSEPYKIKNYDWVKGFWLHIAYFSPSPSQVLIYDAGAAQWNIQVLNFFLLFCTFSFSKRLSPVVHTPPAAQTETRLCLADKVVLYFKRKRRQRVRLATAGSASPACRRTATAG